MTDPWDEGHIHLPTWMVDFYGFHVGKYTSPIDPMGRELEDHSRDKQLGISIYIYIDRDR